MYIIYSAIDLMFYKSCARRVKSLSRAPSAGVVLPELVIAAARAHPVARPHVLRLYHYGTTIIVTIALLLL